MNGDFLKITEAAIRFRETVDNFAAIIHRSVVKARHRSQIKIKRPVRRGNNVVFIVAHDTNRHRIVARDIQRVRAEGQFDALHFHFAKVKVKRNFFNLNVIAEKVLNLFNRVETFDAVETELTFEIFQRRVFLNVFAFKIGIRAANENINQIVKNARGD